MPQNFIDANGLTIQTRQQILDELKNGADGFLGFLAIYGADANLASNSPDGQLLNLIAQAKVDVLEVLAQIYASFNPDQAIGRALDQRCAINGVVRKAGTYTLQNVEVTATQALTVTGLDDDPDAPFTVQDAAGNRFVLLESFDFSGAATESLAFRAEKLGAVATAPNTITQVVTVQLGVSSVNNPDAATSTGIEEETDNALRIRRARSVSIPSKGYLEGLVGALLAIDEVTDVLVLENVGSAPDANGIPGHSIWVLALGGTNEEIAEAIYVKRNAGCGMKGAVSVPITQVDGTTFDVLFDRPDDEDLWISFNLTAITGVADDDYVRNQILAQLSYGINQPADASAIVALVKAIAPNCYVSGEGVSDVDGGYVALKATPAVDARWTIDTVRIKINGSVGP